MTEAEKQAQMDEMWREHVHGPWWELADYYHSTYRHDPWPEGARDELARARAAAEADPRG